MTETYFNRAEPVKGGLTVTCVCNHTVHFSADEVSTFALDMTCPNCGRVFWTAKQHRKIFTGTTNE